ncbi:DNA/RNA polymerase [Coemansia reversa NRRL 1564]|uniref:DNA/RNA polymerase n=1 Tax=Coemansia reversa (strain ATCC 12441 / NRRL 1564) TaxID=763665 RepID=A0A2G5BG54_COERN|nr:DNA/RNA polymerase [Coemansia reversa NRRL 1564]|eukprot:PIA17981.1 DNA/RNA polymerase [Coemansia reversa NRRL 1564]
MTGPDEHRLLAEAELAQHRAIIHIDLDCFYCQVEQLRLGISPDIPLAVQQWQGLVAVNYAARAFGVKRMDTVQEAREKCPELKLVHVATFMGSSLPAYHKYPSAKTHKVSLDEYRRASRKIMEVIKRMCPTMSKASIDEAYMDVTELVRDQVLEDFERGAVEITGGGMDVDTSEVDLGQPVVRWVKTSRKGKEREPVVVSGATSTEWGVLVGEAAGVSFGWSDLVLRYAAGFARRVRGALLQELGYRASAGVAHNRFLAKIGSGLNKPDQQTVLLQAQVERFLETLPISSIPSLGGKLGALVEASFDALTAGDLRAYSLEQLTLKLGAEQAKHVYNRSRGIDDSPVVDGREPATLTSAKNFLRFPAGNMTTLDRWVSMNSVDLWTRVLEEWEARRRWPRSLTVGYTSRGKSLRSRTVSFPPRCRGAKSSSPDVLAATTRACLKEIAAGDRRMFPLVGFMITARSFQRELASASAMDRWLSRARPAPVPGVISATPIDKEDEMDEGTAGEATSLMSTHSRASANDFSEEDISALQTQRLSSTMQMFTQPTTQIQPSSRSASSRIMLPLQTPHTMVTSPSHITVPLQDAREAVAQSPTLDSESTTSSATTPPPSSGFSFPGVKGNPVAVPSGMQTGGMQYSNVLHPLKSVPQVSSANSIEPELVAGSEFDTSDTDMSYLETPQEGLSDEIEESSDESGSDSNSEDDNSSSEKDKISEEQGAYLDIDSHRPQSHAPAESSQQESHVYIQPSTDFENVSRFGEGYRNMHLDSNDDGTLEAIDPVDVMLAADGFMPALIAAVRRKREIQIIRIESTVDCPVGVISKSDDEEICKTPKGKRKNKPKSTESDIPVVAGSSRASNTQNHLDDSDFVMDVDEHAFEYNSDASSSSEDGLDMVIDMAVSAMMESISASQTVMQIRCPQCPSNAPSISSKDWETHRDWHIARHLQEREMRHESVARQIQRAFDESPSSATATSKSKKPATKRVKRDPQSASSSKPRQQTITDAWK